VLRLNPSAIDYGIMAVYFLVVAALLITWALMRPVAVESES